MVDTPMPHFTVGSKAQVFHGTAHHTKCGLTRKNLIRNTVEY
jgi:hypothetical protein